MFSIVLILSMPLSRSSVRVQGVLFLASLYRVFINNCVFSLKFVIFLNSASSAAALVFYLPGVFTHTNTPRENGERQEFGIF